MLLQVNNLTILNIVENKILINNLSFVVNKSDKIAIIGEEGNGKSTLLKVLYNHFKLDYLNISGKIVINGKIGYLEQDILSRWNNFTSLNYLLHSNPNEEIEYEEYSKLGNLNRELNRLDFSSYDDNKLLNHYSGGELIKLGLLKLLLNQPNIIFLDEPSNDLDLDALSFLENFILESETPILFISHDQRLLENTATSVIHLYQNKKKKEAISTYIKVNYADYIEQRLNKIEHQTMVAKKQRADHTKKVERFNRIYQSVEHQQNQVVRDPTKGRLLKKKIHVLKSQEKKLIKEEENFLAIPDQERYIELIFDSESKIANGKIILNIKLDNLVIANNVLAININLNLIGPRKIAIIGKNGVGKSTFLKHIFNYLQNKDGIKVGYMPQNYYLVLNEEQTAIEFLLNDGDKKQEEYIRTLLGNALFTSEEMLYKIKNLSGGLKAKLLLTSLILKKPNVLLLDEPTRNISPLNAREIHQLLNSFPGAIIAISHDRAFLEAVFEDIYELTPIGLMRK